MTIAILDVIENSQQKAAEAAAVAKETEARIAEFNAVINEVLLPAAKRVGAVFGLSARATSEPSGSSTVSVLKRATWLRTTPWAAKFSTFVHLQKAEGTPVSDSGWMIRQGHNTELSGRTLEELRTAVSSRVTEIEVDLTKQLIDMGYEPKRAAVSRLRQAFRPKAGS